MRTQRRFLLLALLFIGCAAPRNPWTAPRDDRDVVRTTVVVTNNNWSVVVISVVSMGSVYRLGSVETAATETFLLPRGLTSIGDVELRARPTGLRVEYSTGPILFEPGATIDLTIENLLELSTVVVH
jgi:hypothetical protein